MAKRLYPFPIEPEKYADFHKRGVKVITRAALEDKIQFTTLRAFTPEMAADSSLVGSDAGAFPPLKRGERIAHLEETIDMYVNHFKLGRVLWPMYPTLFAGNFDELVEICRRDGLYLYDFWGFVPGSRPTDEAIWGEYEVPESSDRSLREGLGDRFLGYDNGEQDGRYVHSRARQACPVPATKKGQYAMFQSYFQKLNDAMHNHTVTLSSLTFLPYFAKEENTIMLGAETAQALPSSNMWFSFIRGAAKQYGILYYGNASVWNRWGYKDYLIDSHEPDTSQGFEMGRFAGTSLGLLRRLLYSHYVYGCDILGFENCWLNAREARPDDRNSPTQYTIGNVTHQFTPIGRIQQHCVEFVDRYGKPGVQYTPVALMLPFHAGWVPPRHLYTSDVYKTWGGAPYTRGDHQIHRLFTMLYPQYEDAGFYRDERGFGTATPYGDIADVLLSDARLPVMSRYDTIVLTADVTIDLETAGKLRGFVEGGGHLIAFAGSVVRGHESAAPLFGVKSLTALEGGRYALCAEEGTAVQGLIARRALGQGNITLILHEDGVELSGEAFTADNRPNEPICQPYRLLPEVEAALAEAFRSVQILSIDNPALQYTLSARKPGEYVMLIANHGFARERYNITSGAGAILSVAEMAVEDGVTDREEFLPLLRGEAGAPARDQGEYAIEPGDVRLYVVCVDEQGVTRLPELNPTTSAEGRYLKLPSKFQTIKQALLEWPTFKHHFEGFVVSGRYLEDMDAEAAAREAHYLDLQGVKLWIDFSEMINHYPDLSLIGNLPAREEEALSRIERILDKAALYRIQGVVVCPHRNAENAYTKEQAIEGFTRNVKRIQALCEARSIQLLIKNRPFAPDARGFDLPYALDTAVQLCEKQPEFPDHTAALLLSSPMRDEYGQWYCMNLPIQGSSSRDALTEWAADAATRNLPILLTADYADWDQVIADLSAIGSLG